MKKLLSILFLSLAFLSNSQTFLTLTKTKIFDEYGGTIAVTSETIRVCINNISSVEPSGSGSIVMLRAAQFLDGAKITGYSVTSTPDQINTASSATAATAAYSDGTVSAPSVAWASEAASGWYRIGANNYGFAVNGTKTFEFASTGATLQGNTTTAKAIIKQNTSTAYTSNSTITAAELSGGLITVTSGTLTLTLPTTTLIAAQIGAVAGTVFDFVVNNSGSGGTVTIAVGAGIVASGFPSANTLTLANSATVGIAGFRLTFLSATAATLTRIN